MDDLRLVKLKGFAKIDVQFDPKKDDGSLLLRGYALKITLIDNNPDQIPFTLLGTLPFEGIISREDNSIHFLNDLPVVFNQAWFNKFPNLWGADTQVVNFPGEMNPPGSPDPGNGSGNGGQPVNPPEPAPAAE